MNSHLNTEIQYVKGVGPALAELFAKVSIRTVRDLLLTLPRRYEDRRNLPRIRDVRPGQQVTMRGQILGIDSKPTRGGKVIFKATISDGSGTLSMVWFNQPWIKRKLEKYTGELIAYGTIREAGWSYEMHSPEFELLEEGDSADEFAQIVPVYPLTEGLRQSVVRRAVANAMQKFLPDITETLPTPLLIEQRMKGLMWCLREVHQPKELERVRTARRRLVFEEFLGMQLALQDRRLRNHKSKGIAFPIRELEGKSLSTIVGSLFGEAADTAHYSLRTELAQLYPFQLTGAQRRVIEEIWHDMERPFPMNRLVQGDVGSGKTAVAAASMLAAVRCGYQCAMMAPTEILAEQHFRNLTTIFDAKGIRCELLVGKQSKGKKKEVIGRSKASVAQILVGTHALIEDDVAFSNLGLVVIDEQHRFGVNQRLALSAKSDPPPDVLVMTATPIPRTLCLTTYGHLDLSILDELPPGRKPIETSWRPLQDRTEVYNEVRKLLTDGAQAYVVCPMVSESEKLQAQAAEELFERLQNEVYTEFRLGLLHGQMRPADKDRAIEAFRNRELDLLVSTTVIEVGVDVPNASIMVIEDANRFGLAQLHQLRGRVGRGSAKSYCILLADAKSEDAQTRMEMMVRTQNGFLIAEADLEIRGAGDLAGTKQSGEADFRLADMVHDSDLLETARDVAIRVLESDPLLSSADNELLKPMLDEHRQRLDRMRPT